MDAPGEAAAAREERWHLELRPPLRPGRRREREYRSRGDGPRRSPDLLQGSRQFYQNVYAVICMIYGCIGTYLESDLGSHG